MNSSLDGLGRALLAKDKSADIQARLDAADKMTDPKERDAAIAKINDDQSAQVNAALHDKSLGEEIKTMDATKRSALGASAFNFTLAMLQDKALSEQAMGLISSLSANPMMLSKLGAVKDAAGSVSNQVSAGSEIAGKMPAVFSAVGVQAPTSKDEKPREVNKADL